jgi:hypothetical protein
MQVYKEIICAEAVNLSKEDKRAIIRIVKKHDKEKAKRVGGGTRIVLDYLPDNVVKDIYTLIRVKLELPDIN